MNEKFEKAVDAIIKKTENGKIEWERTDIGIYNSNPFFHQYICDNCMEFDGINSYVAPYNNGFIYFTNQTDDGYRELAIQPNNNADITVISTGRSQKLKTLEETIKSDLDNPDDFINSLLN